MERFNFSPSITSRRRHRNARAFTLIEMLMVIAVLAIMSGIVVPQVSSAVLEAKEAAMLGDLRELSTAIERYRIEHSGESPDLLTARAMPQLMLQTNADGIVGTGPGYGYGPYLKDGMPANPLNNSSDVYRVNSSPPTNLANRVGWAYNPDSGCIWAGLYVGEVP